MTKPIWANPYALQVVADVAPYGLAVSYPYRSRVSGGSSGNSGANRYYAHGIVHEFIFSAQEWTTKPTFQIVDWADIGVNVRMQTSDSAKLESTFTSGAAYVTARYTGVSPKLMSTSAITSINGKAPTSQSTWRGTKFSISYNNGQKWLVYALTSDATAEKEITWKVEGGSVLRSTAVFDGVLRAALAVTDVAEDALDKHKILDSDSAYSFLWQTHGDCTNGLLQYAMPHHIESIDPASARKVEGLTAFSTTRGALQAYTTLTQPPVWKLHETQPVPEDLYPTRKLSADVVRKQHILEHLRNDITTGEWAIPVGGSYYFNGKAAQKYASLCLMASDSAIVGSDMSLLQTCLSKLRKVMAPYVTNGWTNKLQYDRVYGGVVSSEGFKKNDLNADFGNTMYNDHHFHYGYWIYASAIINRLDPTWSELSKLNAMTNLLVQDVANYDRSEQSFPRFRSFDWFRGHSYSHGVTPLADGKDEESTSEDINFAFGMYMYGKATSNQAMQSVGKLMTRLNAHAIKTYFLIESQSQVHPTNFRPNKVTGIFFDNKVDYATWFSAEKYCIHGIQMLPVSPVTEFVRTKQFVQEEWEQVLSKEKIVAQQDTSNSWLSILMTNYAMVDKATALAVLQKAKMDDGLTRAWALYMAASLPN
ncbi:TPA: hypothetical protein N0F65_008780 [Lagenidium giganteum]|uniref:glucan endo-1,3-beta-D-glucosidase n=1 Tax=Lagenidium giganteum TaxID=4803 RepID=A0AAV2Z328_9STRA|nr:TPA: hypothetical protein N0F65_008780 [Lagenidium giganteum]